MVVLGAGLAILLAAIVFAVILSRERLRRHRVFRVAPGEERARAPQTIPPVDQWTDTFERLEPDDLASLLESIETKHPDLYSRWSLAYLHARSLIEENELDEAAERMKPFLSPGNAFRNLALYHQGEIEETRGNHEAASALRQQLISSDGTVYREQAIEEEADYLTSKPDRPALTAFVQKVSPSLSTTARRDLNARVVDALMQTGNTAAAFSNAMALLKSGNTDDAADRAGRALDRPEIISKMTPEQRALLGETFQNHRHYDRAIALLSSIPLNDEHRFALGRCYFGAEKFAEAQQVYMTGANATKDMRWKTTFLFHASRAAQLQGDDPTAERLMTAAVAVKGKFPATTAALTQRIRTRLKQKRPADAAGDLQLLRKMAGNERAFAEGSLAYALGVLGAGNDAAATSALNSIPPKLLDKFDVTEVAYWRARAQEKNDLRAAFNAYLSVLRASVPTHFAYFARERLDSPALAPKLKQEVAIRDAQVTNLVNAKKFDLAKQIETDRILLSSTDHQRELQRLASIYGQLPAYRTILELKPEPLPRFPLQDASDRTTLLMAMGLYDEVVDEVRKRYPLRNPRSALTQAIALNRGNASRESIYAVEVLMNQVPDDYHPELLPLVVRQLLYPRYFYDYIVTDSKKYGADPTLVLSIMREESRFNPRAKSGAAARGLLQFIITTARDIGRGVGLVDVDPEDLYDPRVIIQLGAKYVSELSNEFAGDHYRTAAAYNAGPKQVALWSRLAPSDGDDWFLSSINFDETKAYVRKVMNSHKRYGEIYGNAGPAGGLRVEP